MYVRKNPIKFTHYNAQMTRTGFANESDIAIIPGCSIAMFEVRS